MRSLILLGVFVFPCIANVGAADHRCCIMDQFEASIGETISSVQDGGQPQVIEEFSMGAFDFNKNRTGLETDVTIVTSGTKYRIKTIQLFTENIVYTIINDACTKSKLGKGIGMSKCVPPEAQYLNSFYSGFGDDRIYANMWEQKVTPAQTGNLDGTVYQNVQDKTCVPLSFGFLGYIIQNEIRTPAFFGGNYMNFTAGIKNPSQWFVPPKNCPKDFSTEDAFQKLDPVIRRSILSKPLFFR